MNTLYLYDGDKQTYQIAVTLSSILSMGKYASYDASPAWDRYGRIVFIMGPGQEMFSHFPVWSKKTAGKSLIFLWNGMQNTYMDRVVAAVQAQLGCTFDLTAFISAEDFLDDTLEAAERIRALTPPPQADDATLQAMEDFLRSHNTGVLASGAAQDVRATPIEYLYFQKKLYFFSEGGEKFFNLYRNPHAAFAVCDAFTDVRHLGGLQIEGKVRFLEPGEDDYAAAAAAKGIAPERLKAMPVILHVIELTPQRLTFLWSGFAAQKKALRQVYTLQ